MPHFIVRFRILLWVKRAALILLVVAISATSLVSSDDLPPDCCDADFSQTGRPVMFPARNGLAMGISATSATFAANEPIPIYIWVDNQTDVEKVLLSCSMWWSWDIDVFGANGRRMKTRGEKEAESTPASIRVCYRNVPLRIPPHSCGPLQDMGNVKRDLTKLYELPAGTYFVTEGILTFPLRGLTMTVGSSTCSEAEPSQVGSRSCR